MSHTRHEMNAPRNRQDWLEHTGHSAQEGKREHTKYGQQYQLILELKLIPSYLNFECQRQGSARRRSYSPTDGA